jgi:hypothetical protein
MCLCRPPTLRTELVNFQYLASVTLLVKFSITGPTVSKDVHTYVCTVHQDILYVGFLVTHLHKALVLKLRWNSSTYLTGS